MRSVLGSRRLSQGDAWHCRCALGPFINIIQAACDQQEARSKGICKEEKEDEGEEEGETSTEEEEEESTDQEEDSEEQVHFEWNIDGEPKQLRFSSALFPNYEGIALFPHVAALNHSCIPNCTVTYLDSNEIVVFALRDILKGEELTISYVDQEKPQDVRCEELKERYGFICGCDACKCGLGGDIQGGDDQTTLPPTKRSKKM